MRNRARLRRLRDRLNARSQARPLTVFLVEATADRPPGVRVVWDGIAREVCYNPALGPPPLPPGGPHKIVRGPVFDV